MVLVTPIMIGIKPQESVKEEAERLAGKCPLCNRLLQHPRNGWSVHMREDGFYYPFASPEDLDLKIEADKLDKFNDYHQREGFYCPCGHLRI